jgi:cell division protein FtsB
LSKKVKAIAKLSAKIATLTEKKNRVSAEIRALKDQRAALKAPAAASAAPVAPAKKAKAAKK